MKWNDYENEIYNKLLNEFPGTEIVMNAKIKGKSSKTNRQIDFLIKGSVLGYEVLGVVECKYLSKKVDIKVIDSFVSFLEDVGANLGIIFTNKGYTKGAKRRSESKGIKLDIVNIEDIEKYHIELQYCNLCEPSMACYPAMVNFRFIRKYKDGNGKIHKVSLGYCNWCYSTYIKCPSCGRINGITYIGFQDSNSHNCECGYRFIVMYNKDSDPPFKERIRIITNQNEELICISDTFA